METETPTDSSLTNTASSSTDSPNTTIDDENKFIDVENSSPRKSQEEIVLPPITASGEIVNVSSPDVPEVLYSSLPPDLNKESIIRATQTADTGSVLEIRKVGDKLKIIASSHVLSQTGPFMNMQEQSCIVCQREIEANEMYLNFPDDLDRRRLWGNMLGFRYSEMLRLKIGPSNIAPSNGAICTDHFSEECFRKFNFNKAAIETFGIPLSIAPPLNVTPSKKRTPWECSICSFRNHSVSEMHSHLLNHTKETDLSPNTRKILSEKGLSCPFCRNCTYYYKTLSGFNRHLQLDPITHFYLKRIFEVAKKNFRSSILDPPGDWESWTERNVFYAYNGCEPNSVTPIKRPASASGSETPIKQRMLASPSAIQASLLEQHHIKPLILPDHCYATPEKMNDEYNQSVSNFSSPTNNNNINNGIHYDNEVTIVSPMSPLRLPVAIKSARRDITRGSENTSPTKKATLADALNEVTSENKDDADNEIILEQALNEPLPPNFAVFDDRFVKAIKRKTQRQLESNEARLRLFGDCTYVEVPQGYKKVETPQGPRIISLKESQWTTESAPIVKLPHRRFLPVNRD